MKTFTQAIGSALRSNSLFSAYLLVGSVLIIGLQQFAYKRWDIILLDEIASRIAPVVSYLYELAGWTLFGFVPLALFLCWFTARKITGRSCDKDSAYCRWINELAVGLGLLGTIRGFIIVASDQAANASAGPTETLSAILVGMGSTFIGITLALWALLLQNPAEQ